MPEYLFTSQRLAFRDWELSDLDDLYAMNSDPEVMAFFPKLYTREECRDFIIRMKDQFKQRGYCYFAVDTLLDNQFFGFIGISYQDYEAPFTPCVDIGWRLKKSEWNKGYATEGAIANLKYAFDEMGLKSIISLAPKRNLNSISVMQKIGMKAIMDFNHPVLADYPDLNPCVVYKINKSEMLL